MNKMILKAALALVGVALIGGSGSANAVQYSTTFLDWQTLGKYGINNSGEVVGSSATNGRAVTWNGTVLTELTAGPGYAYGINNSGQVAGATQHATIWNGGVATDLGTLGGTISAATWINDSGQTVGFAFTAGDVNQHATIWNGGVATDLGTLGGARSWAYGINNSGQIVGSAYIAGDAAVHATLWNGTDATDLGTLGGTDSYANGINNSGQIVGWAYTSDNGYMRATIWNDGVATDLGTLGGGHSYGLGINNSGQIVGSAYLVDGITSHAALWNGSVATDLNSFLDKASVDEGWTLIHAGGINDNGWIVGNAHNDLTGQNRVFLLSVTPVPEPETYALMLAGLAAVGVSARRRKAAKTL